MSKKTLEAAKKTVTTTAARRARRAAPEQRPPRPAGVPLLESTDIEGLTAFPLRRHEGGQIVMLIRKTSVSTGGDRFGESREPGYVVRDVGVFDDVLMVADERSVLTSTLRPLIPGDAQPLLRLGSRERMRESVALVARLTDDAQPQRDADVLARARAALGDSGLDELAGALGRQT